MSLIPVKLAFDLIEPINGVNENLAPFIFLHGLGECRKFWLDTPQKLSDETGRRSYVLDARDHGDSEWSNNTLFTVIVDDIIHFMVSQNIPKAVMIGHSVGGQAMARVALKNPEKVEVLILEDTYIHKYSKGVQTTTKKYLCDLEEATQKIPKGLNENEVTRFIVDYLYSKTPPALLKYFTSKECLYKLKYPVKKTPDGSYQVKHNTEILKHCIDMFSLLNDPKGMFRGPAYVFYGNLSPLNVKQHEGQIRRHFPNVKLILFEDATHNVHLEFPEKFIKTVLNCLQKSP